MDEISIRASGEEIKVRIRRDVLTAFGIFLLESNRYWDLPKSQIHPSMKELYDVLLSNLSTEGLNDYGLEFLKQKIKSGQVLERTFDSFLVNHIKAIVLR